MVEPLATQLAAKTTGRVWSRDPADRAGYDEARLGYNRTLVHRPALAVAAATEADIAEAVRFAVEQDLPWICRPSVTGLSAPWTAAC